MSILSPLDRWQAEGTHHEVFGRRLFVRDLGGGGGTPLAILHGFPSCSFDFNLALPYLAPVRRVVVHDHLGFGLSDKPVKASYSLVEQAEMALGLWRELGLEKVHLLAHDYGTSVATELLARRERGLLPLEIASLTLTNGSVLIELAKLTATQQLLRRPWLGEIVVRLSTEGFFVRRMRKTLADPGSVPRRDLEALWAALVHNDGKRVFRRIAGYPDERWRFRDRWVGALERLDLPTLVLWGRRDPIAVPAIAETLARKIPGCHLVWLDEAGHYPMLEVPERWSAEVNRFLENR